MYGIYCQNVGIGTLAGEVTFATALFIQLFIHGAIRGILPVTLDSMKVIPASKKRKKPLFKCG